MGFLKVCLLSIELSELQGLEFDMDLLGFDDKELSKLFDDEKEIQEDDFDVEEELKKKAITKFGDKWHLGKHTLVCGDSTKEETYKKLLGDTKVNLVVTDPPYNVNYEGSAGKIKNDDMEDGAFYQFLLLAFTQAEKVMASDSSIAWCCGRHIEDKEQCSMKYVEEEAIKHAFIMMMNKLIFGRDYLLNPLKKQLAKLNSRSIDKQLEALQEKIVEKQIKLEETEKLFYGEYLDFKSYSRIKNQLLSDQERLNAQSNHLLSNDYNKKKSKMYLDKLIEFVQKSCYLAEFDDVVFSEFIENIEVINRTKVKFILKCGLALEERLD